MRAEGDVILSVPLSGGVMVAQMVLVHPVGVQIPAGQPILSCGSAEGAPEAEAFEGELEE